jgi:pyruvate dehydrogenase E2 component (dihydrolipoamide acetyltransferase)
MHREVGGAIPVVADIDFAKFGPVRREERSRIDKVTAANMSKSWLNVPHVTQFDDADITDLEAFRASLKAESERRGSKLSPVPFVIKAVAIALNANPKMKSSLAEQGRHWFIRTTVISVWLWIHPMDLWFRSSVTLISDLFGI